MWMHTLQPEVAIQRPRLSHDERIDDPETGVPLSVHGSRSCAGRTARQLSLILRRWKGCDAEGVGPHEDVVATHDVNVRRRSPGLGRRGTVDALVNRRLVDEKLELLTRIPAAGGQLHVPAELPLLVRPHGSYRDRALALDRGDARCPIAADTVSEMMRFEEGGERRRTLGRDGLGKGAAKARGKHNENSDADDADRSGHATRSQPLPRLGDDPAAEHAGEHDCRLDSGLQALR